jgi:hypothetical protein
MPIVAGDIRTRYSTRADGGGNVNTQPDPNQSLGRFASTTEWAGGSPNSLFDDIYGDENRDLDQNFRCLFIHNTNATITYINPVVWLTDKAGGGAGMAIGIDPTAASAAGSPADQALTIATETTAPAGVAFSAPTTKATGLALGNLAPGQVRAIWVRRTATNSPAQDDDGFTLNVEGDTTS